MPRQKKPEPPELEDNDSEFAAVFSDLMSFLAGLFILLFTIVNTQKNTPAYFTEMSIKFGGKIVEQKQKVTSEDLFVSDVRKFIRDEEISQYAVVLVDEQKIRLIFNDPILFQSGTDILTRNSKAVLNGLINIIKQVKNPLIIEGHTDDIPVKPDSKFRNNWDLAYFRAASVANYLMAKGVQDSRISITSFGDKRPLARKKTYLARKKNRRIEINIIRVKEKK
ncbi:MAG: OmpA family protein [Candidatus Margulisiibacteriota bacterium]